MDEQNKKEIQQMMMMGDVVRLYYEVSDYDDVIREYFDVDSKKDLKKKIKVLQMVKDGMGPGDIGKPYYEVLEKLDVPEGIELLVDGGNIINPHEYD